MNNWLCGISITALLLAAGCSGPANTSPAEDQATENAGSIATEELSVKDSADSPDLAGQQAGAKEDVQQTPADSAPGLAVGQPAPDFALQDQHGQTRTLSELLKDGNVALVFYRSADW